jgi:hypothetical protein
MLLNILSMGSMGSMERLNVAGAQTCACVLCLTVDVVFGVPLTAD